MFLLKKVANLISILYVIRTGIAGNLMDGLQWDMIDLVKSGNNPVGAIDKRLTATKEQAITLAKKYKLVP